MVQAKLKGDYLFEQLISLNSPAVDEVRGRGLMAAVELKKDNAADIAKKALKKGLIVNKSTDKVLRFLPPLTITEKELDEGVQKLEKVLK